MKERLRVDKQAIFQIHSFIYFSGSLGYPPLILKINDLAPSPQNEPQKPQNAKIKYKVECRNSSNVLENSFARVSMGRISFDQVENICMKANILNIIFYLI